MLRKRATIEFQMYFDVIMTGALPPSERAAERAVYRRRHRPCRGRNDGQVGSRALAPLVGCTTTRRPFLYAV